MAIDYSLIPLDAPPATLPAGMAMREWLDWHLAYAQHSLALSQAANAEAIAGIERSDALQLATVLCTGIGASRDTPSEISGRLKDISDRLRKDFPDAVA